MTRVYVFTQASKAILMPPKIQKITHASVRVSLWLGRGLVFVLATFPSRFLSQISLITHPADRTTILPSTTMTICQILGLPLVLIKRAISAGQSSK